MSKVSGGMEERQEQHREITNKKRHAIRIGILVIVASLFVFSAYKVISIYSEYRKGEKEYEKIAEDVIEEQVPEKQEETLEQEGRTPLKVDFDALSKVNQDVVGWIHFDEPKQISYPIVRGEDNLEYLKTTFEGKKNSAGAIFMDALDNKEFSDRNTFIYGHNMKNGSMFAQLHKYNTKDFYDKNPYFYIYTPDGKEVKYQIFAVCLAEGNSRSYSRFYTGDADYLDYLNHEKSLALYDTGVEVNEKSKIVSLSTCTKTSRTKRLLVHAVKVDERVVGE